MKLALLISMLWLGGCTSGPTEIKYPSQWQYPGISLPDGCSPAPTLKTATFMSEKSTDAGYTVDGYVFGSGCYMVCAVGFKFDGTREDLIAWIAEQAASEGFRESPAEQREGKWSWIEQDKAEPVDSDEISLVELKDGGYHLDIRTVLKPIG